MDLIRRAVDWVPIAKYYYIPKERYDQTGTQGDLTPRPTPNNGS
jgi:hypothetical protein